MLVSVAGAALGDSVDRPGGDPLADPLVDSLGDSLSVTTLVPGEAINVAKLAGAIQLLEDREGKLDIQTVSALPPDAGFVAGSLAAANVGFSPSVWWVRFTLRNPGKEDRFVYLRQDYPLIDLLDLYEPTPDGHWRVHSTGDRRPFSSRDVLHRDFLFPLQIPAGTDRTIHLRYQSQGPIDINLALLDANELAGALSREQLAYGIYFGCVLMLLVWSGFVFIAVRDRAFLAYFAYVATFGIYMMVNTGFAFQYLWPDSPRWANTCLIVLLNLSLITALQFSTDILRSKDYTPRLDKIARALQLVALIAIGLIPLFDYSVLVKPVTFLILVSVIFMLALGGVNMLAGSRPARFYVLAWGAFLAGSIIFLFKNFGLVPHTFFTQHSWQVGGLVEMILLSMTLSSRMNELKHQSRTDPLTLLGNRRLFDDRFPQEFVAAQELSKPLSVLMLDIDRFKAYNDRHGHAQGDEAIKMVAAALRRYARKPFVACRYGGEEFCVILPNTPAKSAALVAERLRAAVQAAAPGEFGITISVGHACLTGDEFPSPEKLFEAADAALYSAKDAGRNRVMEFHGRRTSDPAASVPPPG